MNTTNIKKNSGLGLEEVEPWAEAVDGAALLEELWEVIQRYVVLPPMAAETLALWTVHTYAFELRDGCATLHWPGTSKPVLLELTIPFRKDSYEY